MRSNKIPSVSRRTYARIRVAITSLQCHCIYFTTGTAVIARRRLVRTERALFTNATVRAGVPLHARAVGDLVALEW